ncbi:MAG TPA: DUF1800 domain-containing protein [Thermoleophilaceae bacterium]|nr:DUF1800 domain-containing protein [Thermoleophilaceae bacterium]
MSRKHTKRHGRHAGWNEAHVRRLFWRAGFGATPREARHWARRGKSAAIRWLLHGGVAPVPRIAGPSVDGQPLDPVNEYGHDALWWLDRMVRSPRPLQEKMTLFWHDHFATTDQDTPLMLAQNRMLRRHALGRFPELLRDVTRDPAMLLHLSLADSDPEAPNENYARELMELFTLGADRGAYSEDDVRELARALTGWDNDWSEQLGYHNFRFVSNRHDATSKTVFGQTGNFGWEAATAMCVRHAKHPSFFVDKLWSYFIPAPPSAGDRAALEALYVSSGYQVRPLLEAILLHPQLHEGPRMVKPPAVFVAGMLRALRRAIDTDAWTWLMNGAGQRLFYPPDVSGWDDARWLDTSTMRGRWEIVAHGLNGRQLTDPEIDAYDATEGSAAAVAKARAFWGEPSLTTETTAVLAGYADAAVAGPLAGWQQVYFRGLRQNALRHLLFFSPDLQTS